LLSVACLMAILSGLKSVGQLVCDAYTLRSMARLRTFDLEFLRLHKFTAPLNDSQVADFLRHRMYLTMLRELDGALWYFLIASLIAYAIWRLRNQVKTLPG
jgi:hypothetical protein